MPTRPALRLLPPLLFCAASGACGPAATDAGARSPRGAKEVVTVYVTAPCPPAAADKPPACWPVRPELRGAVLDAAGSVVTEAGRSKDELTCDEVHGVK